MVGVQNLFRVRIEASEAIQNQTLTFVDAGDPERECTLAVLVRWQDHALKPALEPVFQDFVRDYREAGSIVSPGSFLEKLVHALDAACNRVDAALLDRMEFAVALCCGRGLYLLHSLGFAATCALDGGSPQPLVSSLRVRVKDLSPSSMRGSHLWSAALVERLRLVRVFFEDEDAAAVQLALPAAEELSGEFGEPAPARAAVVVDKEPALDAVLGGREEPGDAGWPDLGETARRDRRTLSYAAVGLVAVLFATAIFGMWRWHRLGNPVTPPGTDALFSETVDRSLDARSQDARVSAETIDNGGERAQNLRGSRGDDAAAGALSVLWSKRHTDWVTSSPRLAHGRVVYGCRDGHLYSVDPDGDVVWDYDSGAGIGATPAVADGRVYCGNYSGRAFAVRDKDGKELWTADLGSKLVASPAPGQKLVFYATQGGEIVALNKKNGEVAWRYATGGKLRAAPLAEGDRLYAPGGEGELLCLEQKSGKVRWTYEAGSSVQSSPLLADGKLVFGCKDGSVHAVAAKDGAQVWTQRTRGAVQSTPGTADGLVFVGSSDRRLYALQLGSGDIAWKFPTQAPILASPAVLDHKVYITAYDKHTYVLEAKSGRELGKIRLKAPIYSSPLVAAGRIYCGSNDGTLYCMSDIRD